MPPKRATVALFTNASATSRARDALRAKTKLRHRRGATVNSHKPFTALLWLRLRLRLRLTAHRFRVHLAILGHRASIRE